MNIPEGKDFGLRLYALRYSPNSRKALRKLEVASHLLVTVPYGQTQTIRRKDLI
jgi:hypothetical protein